MKAYFVRKILDREAVGLFVASSAVLLAALTDECCDPNSCEYAVAGMGGLMLLNITAAKWPRADADGTETGLEEAVFSQQWEDDLGGDRLEWKPLGPAARRLLRSAKRNLPSR